MIPLSERSRAEKELLGLKFPWFSKFEKALFVLLLFIPAVWVGFFEILPIQDLPNHLASAYLWAQLSESPFLNQFFEVKLGFYPYLLQPIILRMLLVFGSGFASKVFCFMALIALPMGLYYLIRQVSPTRTYWVLFVFPILFNKLFFKGNLAFLLGIGLSFVFMGLLVKWSKSEVSWVHLLFGIGASLVVYVTHLVAYAIGLWGAFFILVNLWIHGEKRKVVWLSLSLAPSLVMAIVFYLSVGSVSEGGVISQGLAHSSQGSDVLENLLQNLLRFDFSKEGVWVVAYLMLFGACFLWALKSFKQNALWLVFILTLWFIYFLLPHQFGTLVRPHERVFFAILFLSPVLFSKIKLKQKLEEYVRWGVVSVCVFLSAQSYVYAFQVGNLVQPRLQRAMELIHSLPSKKKVMNMWGMSPRLGSIGLGDHFISYYVLKEGFVPRLFSTNYMLVRYKSNLEIDTQISRQSTKISLERLQFFDGVFLWGDRPQLQQVCEANGFKLFKQKGEFALYLKEY